MHIGSNNKKIVAVHDLSGVGRVSLMVAIPILSTMGFQVCPLPTAILSGHTQFPTFSFLDLTDEMERIIVQWKKLGMKFDAFYTGYLGSPRQAAIVSEFIADFSTEETPVIVDPVLGDNGKLYTSITEEMVVAMRQLIAYADLITPNMTELFFLLGKPYEEIISEDKLKAYLKELSETGPSIVIVTSVPIANDPTKTSVYAYDKDSHRYWRITCPYLPAHYPGTGDTFTSVITGAILQGDSLPMAMERATQFILQAIRATFGYDTSMQEGIMLEKVLHNLELPLQVSTYEKID